MKLILAISYAAQVYNSLIGILLMPIYMRLMGAEAFGLVGFFLMLQVWLQLTDLGLSPTLSREMSLYCAGAINSVEAWRRIRSLEWFLGLLALCAMVSLVIFRNWIAVDWLTFNQLSAQQVTSCIIAMALAATARLLTGLYRAGLVGMEYQLWVNGMGTLFVTLKFVGVLPLMVYFSAEPFNFFIFQALVGMLELFVFAWKVYAMVPGFPTSPFPTWKTLRSMLPMAGAMAFMAGIWVFLTQIDKMILSRLLTLEVYGYFTLAVVVAGGILSLLTPLNQVLQPRMTILVSQGRGDELRNLYRQATQMVTALFFALGGTLAIFAEAFLTAWTGDTEAVRFAAPILFWYGLANAFVGVLILPFMLQFAHGYLRLHVLGNVLLSITLLPALIYSSNHFGGVGCGITLLIARFLFLFLWVPLVHRRFLPDLVWLWPLNDVGRSAVIIIGILLLMHWMLPTVDNRLISMVVVVLVFLIALFAGLLAGERSKAILVDLVRGRKA